MPQESKPSPRRGFQKGLRFGRLLRGLAGLSGPRQAGPALPEVREACVGLREMAFHSRQPPSTRAQKQPALHPSFLVGGTPGRAIGTSLVQGAALGQCRGDRPCSGSLGTGNLLTSTELRGKRPVGRNAEADPRAGLSGTVGCARGVGSLSSEE